MGRIMLLDTDDGSIHTEAYWEIVKVETNYFLKRVEVTIAPWHDFQSFASSKPFIYKWIKLFIFESDEFIRFCNSPANDTIHTTIFHTIWDMVMDRKDTYKPGETKPTNFFKNSISLEDYKRQKETT